jgi:hypothetical protein
MDGAICAMPAWANAWRCASDLVLLNSCVSRQRCIPTAHPLVGSTTYTPRRRDTKILGNGATEGGGDENESSPHGGQKARRAGGTSIRRAASGIYASRAIRPCDTVGSPLPPAAPRMRGSPVQSGDAGDGTEMHMPWPDCQVHTMPRRFGPVISDGIVL